MMRKRLATLCVAFLVFSLALAGQEGSQEPLDIGSRLELFVDNFLIDTMDRVQLRLHHPVPREVVLVLDRLWEGITSGYPSTVFRDGNIYRMYYRGTDWDFDKRRATHIVTCYAESKDGIHWTRPDLNLFEFGDSRRNNIVWPQDRLGSKFFIAFKDDNPAAPEAQRYKATSAKTNYGFFGFASPDGIHWERIQEEPFFPDELRTDWDHSTFWDPIRNRYWAFLRYWDGGGGSHRGSDGYRSIRYCTSKDFIHWSKWQPIEYDVPPNLGVQLYTNALRPYVRAPHILIGTPKRFAPARKKHPEHKYAGLSDGGLLTSRDGVHFKLWQEAFIRPGLDQQNWIQRNMNTAVGIVETGPSELSLYWVEHYYQEGCRRRRGTLRTDGFVSVNAPYAGGQLTTRHLVFQGRRLVINYSTSAMGSVQVEIQDAAGNPIEGFGLDQCSQIFGDEIERIVTWKGGSDVSRLAGKPVRLRFVMKDADLYSLRFR